MSAAFALSVALSAPTLAQDELPPQVEQLGKWKVTMIQIFQSQHLGTTPSMFRTDGAEVKAFSDGHRGEATGFAQSSVLPGQVQKNLRVAGSITTLVEWKGGSPAGTAHLFAELDRRGRAVLTAFGKATLHWDLEVSSSLFDTGSLYEEDSVGWESSAYGPGGTVDLQGSLMGSGGSVVFPLFREPEEYAYDPPSLEKDAKGSGDFTVIQSNLLGIDVQADSTLGSFGDAKAELTTDVRATLELQVDDDRTTSFDIGRTVASWERSKYGDELGRSNATEARNR